MASLSLELLFLELFNPLDLSLVAKRFLLAKDALNVVYFRLHAGLFIKGFIHHLIVMPELLADVKDKFLLLITGSFDKAGKFGKSVTLNLKYLAF